ncbi:MAG: hypothetical protein C0427_08395 [Rhodobacter sp.]|nr:hypothetical protein [Rhodobacter sp.]
MTGTRMRLAMLPLFILLAACGDSSLPVLSIPLSDNTTFGTDLNAPNPMLGITVTDPLHRMNR